MKDKNISIWASFHDTDISSKKIAFSTRGTVEDSLPTATLAFSTIEVSLSGLSFLQKRQQTSRYRRLSLSRALVCVNKAVDFTTFHADEITVACLSTLHKESVIELLS